MKKIILGCFVTILSHSIYANNPEPTEYRVDLNMSEELANQGYSFGQPTEEKSEYTVDSAFTRTYSPGACKEVGTYGVNKSFSCDYSSIPFKGYTTIIYPVLNNGLNTHSSVAVEIHAWKNAKNETNHTINLSYGAQYHLEKGTSRINLETRWGSRAPYSYDYRNFDYSHIKGTHNDYEMLVTLKEVEDIPPGIKLYAGSQDTSKKYGKGYTDIYEGSISAPKYKVYNLFGNTIPISNQEEGSVPFSLKLKNYNFKQTEARNHQLGMIQGTHIHAEDGFHNFQNEHRYAVCFNGISTPNGEECPEISFKYHLKESNAKGKEDNTITVSITDETKAKYGKKYQIAYSSENISDKDHTFERSENKYADSVICPKLSDICPIMITSMNT